VKGKHRDDHGRFRRMDPSSTGGKVKLGPPPSAIVDKVKLGAPPPQWPARSRSVHPSSSGRIFRASSSWHAKLVEVIDLMSSDEDNDDVLPSLPSYRYEVESDDEDSDDVLQPRPSLLECRKRKALVTDCSNKKV
jgi:hypothetical protein